jgi:hypothetical protein
MKLTLQGRHLDSQQVEGDIGLDDVPLKRWNITAYGKEKEVIISGKFVFVFG